jgi:hypothetical protein
MLEGLAGDCDGDLVAIYSPYFKESVEELSGFIYGSVINPSTGEIGIKPMKEIALGLFQMTKEEEGEYFPIVDADILPLLKSLLPGQKVIYKGRQSTLGRARLILL